MQQTRGKRDRKLHHQRYESFEYDERAVGVQTKVDCSYIIDEAH